MKINEIDHGEKISLSPGEYEQYFQLIEKNCTQALSAIKATKQYIWRGISKEVPPAFHGKSRNNRVTVNIRYFIQDAFDAKLMDHGFKALRSNSIYCTGNLKETGMYGEPYMIFPIDGFNMTWSPTINDLFFKLKKFFKDPEQRFNPVTQKDIDEKFTDELFESMGFQNNDLPAAIISGNEILINGEYYAFNRSFLVEFNKYFLSLD